jgi:hypothetical protein
LIGGSSGRPGELTLVKSTADQRVKRVGLLMIDPFKSETLMQVANLILAPGGTRKLLWFGFGSKRRELAPAPSSGHEPADQYLGIAGPLNL